MTEDKELILKTQFPTVIPQRFYFECANGWFDLVVEICQFISNKTPHCKLTQVKEKFGLLRVYFESEYDAEGEPILTREMMEEIYSFINKKENESKYICEDCGIKLTSKNKASQGSLGYWIRNVCKKCRNEKEKKASEKIKNKDYTPIEK